MMEDKPILEMIKEKKSNDALEEMEKLFKKILLDKIKKEGIDCSKDDFMLLLDFCIKNLKEYYDVLTYLRNLYFFSEKSDSEKLYELANIYEILSN